MSATVNRPVAACWLHLLLQRRPHQVVGPTHAPYLMRWFVLPHNRFVNVRVQTFTASDDPEIAHDQPWWFRVPADSGVHIDHTWAGRAHAGAQVWRCGQRRFSIASSYPSPRTGGLRCAERGGDRPQVTHVGILVSRSFRAEG